MTPTRRVPVSTSMQAWLLVALLLVAQGLGLAHRVAHAPGSGPARVTVSALGHVQGHDQAQAHGPAVWVDGHEADTAECRLIDQLGHADGLCAVAWAAPSVPQASDAPAGAPAVAPRAGSAAAYQARAPPLA